MLPIVDSLTADEVQEALAKALLAKNDVPASKIPSVLASADVIVKYKNLKPANGTVFMIATVAIIERPPSATDTPLPEKGDG